MSKYKVTVTFEVEGPSTMPSRNPKETINEAVQGMFPLPIEWQVGPDPRNDEWETIDDFDIEISSQL